MEDVEEGTKAVDRMLLATERSGEVDYRGSIAATGTVAVGAQHAHGGPANRSCGQIGDLR